mmetsp:Transcript_6192/g.18275  ORF Transcript_6192/g.18275 Transcript_6192/m.18275 type:complete len:205 (-) Transcript_6192:2-616(-)
MKLHPDSRSEGAPHFGHLFHCIFAMSSSNSLSAVSAFSFRRCVALNCSQVRPSWRSPPQRGQKTLSHSGHLTTSAFADTRNFPHCGEGHWTMASELAGCQRLARNCRNFSQSGVPASAPSICATVISFLHPGMGHTSSSSATCASLTLESRYWRKHSMHSLWSQSSSMASLRWSFSRHSGHWKPMRSFLRAASCASSRSNCSCS